MLSKPGMPDRCRRECGATYPQQSMQFAVKAENSMKYKCHLEKYKNDNKGTYPASWQKTRARHRGQ